MFDLRFDVRYYAKEKEWRIYTEDGSYRIAKSIDGIQEAIRNSMRSGANRLVTMANEGES